VAKNDLDLGDLNLEVSGEGPVEDVQPVNDAAEKDADREKVENLKDQKAERQLRKKYAGRAFWFAVAGVSFWCALLVWNGWATYYTGKSPFSDNLLIAVTTATSINLFAAFLGVIRGLFPAGGKRSGG
jgi:hypothetical protein